MCSITGISLRSEHAEKLLLSYLAKQLDCCGSDKQERFACDRIALASVHCSTTYATNGQQSLLADSKQLVLATDGEIYNRSELRAELEAKGYRFTAQPDCEALLCAYREYGDDFLQHLNGMFALALYDKHRKRLLLARDRLGIKPLFLRHLPDGIAFASQLKALLPLGAKPTIDPRGLAEYMAHQFIAGGRTIWADTEKVMPGEAVVIETGRITKRWRYWDARRIESRVVDYEAAAAEFDGLFEQVCREQLRTDEPIGLFLSGGVDSGMLLGQLSRLHTKPLPAYSVGFGEGRYRDELPLARAQAERFNASPTAIRPTTDDLLRALPQAVWAADDLMRDFANLPTLLLAQAASGQHKVVFSGEGADEVFGGYRRYRIRLEDRIKALIRPGSGGFRTSSDVSSKEQRQLYGDDLLSVARYHRNPFIEAWQATPKGWSDLQRRQYVDLVTALPDNLLVKADRMLARYGVQGRMPFLDHRVVEFGFGLPDSLKIRNGHGKWFLKEWASRFLDREQLFARKRGFNVPLLSHIGATEIERLRRVLPEQAGVREWFCPEGVRALLAADQARGKLSRTAFSIMQFAIWHNLFIVGDGSAPTDGLHPLELLETGA